MRHCSGLAFSNNFAALMVFRGLQAAGSSATISIGMALDETYEIILII